MAHVFTDPETGREITISLKPIKVVAEPIGQDFYDLLEEFGEKCEEILHPSDAVLEAIERNVNG